MQVAATGMAMCTFGVAPSTLIAVGKVMATTPAASIMDFKPIGSLPPFGMCTTPSNPTVASATAAALGVLTPMPCIPATAAPWMPGKPTTMNNYMPDLDANSKCMCSYGGVISLTNPGQTKVILK